ncbi:MAG: response regulator transcription factor [Dehalococcoidia bacterium]|nr:MAG: response regulator transcription factor [Dehalococcoidia bacterium]
MNTIRILLAEDHVVVREGTRQLLEREQDFEIVGEAGDGEETVRLASQLKPDVVIIDVAMPKISGIEATKQIKAILPATTVLVLTGYDYDEYIFSMLEAGAAGYLLKSVSGDELINAVRAVYAGEPMIHPTVLRKLITRFKTLAAEPAPVQPMQPLSEREMEVLKIAAQGMSNKDIGNMLFISKRTVQAHMRSIFNKLGVGSRSEAILYSLKRGWFTIEDLP